MGKFQGLLIPEFQAPSSQRELTGGSFQVHSKFSTVPQFQSQGLSSPSSPRVGASFQVPGSSELSPCTLERMEDGGEVLKRDLKFQRSGNERAKSKVPVITSSTWNLGLSITHDGGCTGAYMRP